VTGTTGSAAVANMADGGGGGPARRGNGQGPLNRRRACRLMTDGPTAASWGASGRATSDGLRGGTAARSARRSQDVGPWKGARRPWKARGAGAEAAGGPGHGARGAAGAGDVAAWRSVTSTGRVVSLCPSLNT
jgi:hypothetical protein